MAWTIEYARSARKSVEKLDPQARKNIRRYLEERIAGMDDPRTSGKALHGLLGGLWRYRVGDYRIVCEIQDQRLIVLVLTVGHRRNVYQTK